MACRDRSVRATKKLSSLVGRSPTSDRPAESTSARVEVGTGVSVSFSSLRPMYFPVSSVPGSGVMTTALKQREVRQSSNPNSNRPVASRQAVVSTLDVGADKAESLVSVFPEGGDQGKDTTHTQQKP